MKIIDTLMGFVTLCQRESQGLRSRITRVADGGDLSFGGCAWTK